MKRTVWRFGGPMSNRPQRQKCRTVIASCLGDFQGLTSTTYHQLPTTHDLLPTTCYPPKTTSYRPLATAYDLPPASYYPKKWDSSIVDVYWFLAHGSGLMVHGSRFVAQGPWLKAHGAWPRKNERKKPQDWVHSRQVFSQP